MNELVDGVDTTPTTSNTFELVDVESAKAFMDNYQQVVDALLDDKDYQKMGKSKFKKKSAWRKLATAFNISDTIINSEEVRDDNNQIISAKYYVKATLPNGRSSIGVGSCSIFDKITKKDASQPSNFVLRNRFNNAEHDVPSTAHTRAKSRAIADLIGAGEVSAEEMEGYGQEKNVTVKAKSSKKTTVSKKKAVKPKKPVKEETITVEAEVIDMSDKPAKSIKDLMDEDKNIKKAVDELREENRTVNRDSVKDRLLTLMQSGAVTEEDYKKAKELLE